MAGLVSTSAAVDYDNKYQRAVSHLPSVASELSQEQLLYFYARYKQVEEGQCNIPKPGFLSLQARRKWQAWKDLGDMSSKQAMLEYVQELDKICPTWDKNTEGKDSNPIGLGVSVSTLRGNCDNILADDEKTALDWVKEGDAAKFKSFLDSNKDMNLNEQDEEGMTMLHWASDRGYTDIVEILLNRGANINIQDNTKQTALHYACSCNHLDAVKLLVSRQANAELADEDGLKPRDCSSDPEIKSLINSVATVNQKSYTIEFKRQVVRELRETLNGNISAAAKKFKVDRKRIREWREKEADFNQATTRVDFNTLKRRRLDNKKSTARHPQLEADVIEWIQKLRVDGVKVRGDPICAFAKQRADIYGLSHTQFKASRGWLQRFLRRHKLTCRAVKSLEQHFPINAATLARKFIRECKITTLEKSIVYVANMDETHFSFEFPASCSIDFSDVKTSKCKSTGYEKITFSAALCACSNGAKLPVFIIFKGPETVPKGKFPSNSVVTVGNDEIMKGELMETWIETVWKRRPGVLVKSPAMLTLGVQRVDSHIEDILKKQHGTSLITIPEGMTSLLQPCDVSWNKPVKDALREKWQEWLVAAERECTASGTRKRASYETVVKMVCDAWSAVDKSIIERSFACTGTTSDNVEIFHSNLKKLVADSRCPQADGVRAQNEDSDFEVVEITWEAGMASKNEESEYDSDCFMPEFM